MPHTLPDKMEGCLFRNRRLKYRHQAGILEIDTLPLARYGTPEKVEERTPFAACSFVSLEFIGSIHNQTGTVVCPHLPNCVTFGQSPLPHCLKYCP